MEKRKDYLLWISLGFAYYLFIWKLSYTIYDISPNFLSYIYGILDTVNPYISDLVKGGLFSFIIVFGLFKMRNILENDHYYYLQPILFICGFLINILIFEIHINLVNTPSYSNNLNLDYANIYFFCFEQTIYLIPIVFIIFNGFAKHKKDTYFIVAIFFQCLITYYKSSTIDTLFSFTANPSFSALLIASVFFIGYAASSIKIYDTIFHPYE